MSIYDPKADAARISGLLKITPEQATILWSSIAYLDHANWLTLPTTDEELLKFIQSRHWDLIVELLETIELYEKDDG
jgi:hypothetical protein